MKKQFLISILCFTIFTSNSCVNNNITDNTEKQSTSISTTNDAIFLPTFLLSVDNGETIISDGSSDVLKFTNSGSTIISAEALSKDGWNLFASLYNNGMDSVDIANGEVLSVLSFSEDLSIGINYTCAFTQDYQSLLNFSGVIKDCDFTAIEKSPVETGNEIGLTNIVLNGEDTDTGAPLVGQVRVLKGSGIHIRNMIYGMNPVIAGSADSLDLTDIKLDNIRIEGGIVGSVICSNTKTASINGLILTDVTVESSEEAPQSGYAGLFGAYPEKIVIENGLFKNYTVKSGTAASFISEKTSDITMKNVTFTDCIIDAHGKYDGGCFITYALYDAQRHLFEQVSFVGCKRTGSEVTELFISDTTIPRGVEIK